MIQYIMGQVCLAQFPDWSLPGWYSPGWCLQIRLGRRSTWGTSQTRQSACHLHPKSTPHDYVQQDAGHPFEILRAIDFNLT